MKIEYDRDADAVYIYIRETEVGRTVEISDGVNADLDFNGNLIGIEIIDATQKYSLSDIFNLRTENLFLDHAMMSKQENAENSAVLH